MKGLGGRNDSSMFCSGPRRAEGRGQRAQKNPSDGSCKERIEQRRVNKTTQGGAKSVFCGHAFICGTAARGKKRGWWILRARKRVDRLAKGIGETKGVGRVGRLAGCQKSILLAKRSCHTSQSFDFSTKTRRK